MDIKRVNPFNELYVTETVSPEMFVELFSPLLLENILPLYQKGNVIVKGIQGSGKSMMLALLKPEIRIAYSKSYEPYPLPPPLHNFLSGGINFITSAATEFGQRPFEPDAELNAGLLPLYLADFVNYWVARDLLQSLLDLSAAETRDIGNQMGLVTDTPQLDEFARELAADPCWFDSLKGTRDFQDLRLKLRDRIIGYRSFLAFNSDLPSEIRSTKTAIGSPISVTAEFLYSYNIVPRSVPFFVWLDQYEQLTYLDNVAKDLGRNCQSIINKALTRDERISYKICTRPYGWPDLPEVFSDQSILEDERDYKTVDIDQILRRKENVKYYIFPSLAADVFRRRLKKSNYRVTPHILRKALGTGAPIEERLRQYAATTSQQRAVKKDPTITEEWKTLLCAISERDPLSSKLAEAWYRQQSRKIQNPPIPDEPFPWMRRSYWRKERINQAMMQLAAQGSQRLVWSGYEDVLSLSGGNILVFVSICQHIWNEWTKSGLEGGTGNGVPLEVPTIDPLIQIAGIDSAGKHWYRKITGSTGCSARRQAFLNLVGRYLRQLLLSDEAMSYPGRNGFSVRVDELQREESIYDFLKEAVDYGDLVDTAHTTKEKNKKPRRKYYLNPVLSPYFQIPVTHVKEPLYISTKELRYWIDASSQNRLPEDRLLLDLRPAKKRVPLESFLRQSSLFDEVED